MRPTTEPVDLAAVAPPVDAATLHAAAERWLRLRRHGRVVGAHACRICASDAADLVAALLPVIERGGSA